MFFPLTHIPIIPPSPSDVIGQLFVQRSSLPIKLQECLGYEFTSQSHDGGGISRNTCGINSERLVAELRTAHIAARARVK